MYFSSLCFKFIVNDSIALTRGIESHCKDKLCTQRFTATFRIPTTSSNSRDNVIILESNNHRISFHTHKQAIAILYCHACNLSIAPQINPLVKCVRSIARSFIESPSNWNDNYLSNQKAFHLANSVFVSLYASSRDVLKILMRVINAVQIYRDHFAVNNLNCVSESLIE